MKINHRKSSVKFPHKAHCSSLPKDCLNKFSAIVQKMFRTDVQQSIPREYTFQSTRKFSFFVQGCILYNR